MKHEVYSCLKMIESLHERAVNIYNLRQWNSAGDLGGEYHRIWRLLKQHLTKEQLEFIPEIAVKEPPYDTYKQQYILEVSTGCKIALAYLHSLEMDLDKELKKKEDELKLKEKEIEFMNKLLGKSLEAIKQFPELQRSKIVEEIKKSHRQIEEHTKKQ